MKLSDFNYNLPEKLIAQLPLKNRDSSKMLVVHKDNALCEVRKFEDIVEYINPKDCIVFNNTKVIPARLFAKKEQTNANIEILLIENLEGSLWKAMLKPSKRLKVGTRIIIDSNVYASVIKKNDDGTSEILFSIPDVYKLLDSIGHIPLPPYIKREDFESDKMRYQTVYAEQPGAVAAPTAGLHFSEDILTKLSKKGVKTAKVTLHVGPGTFQPVKVENINEHIMHEETFVLTKEDASIINTTKQVGGKIIAVGTTSVRVLESCSNEHGLLQHNSGRTKLFMYPPYKVKVPNILLTNFHLPKSTLLMLVSCFASKEIILNAYEKAIKGEFRFYSYGDCMLIV